MVLYHPLSVLLLLLVLQPFLPQHIFITVLRRMRPAGSLSNSVNVKTQKSAELQQAEMGAAGQTCANRPIRADWAFQEAGLS